jgi:hypothetical protein
MRSSVGWSASSALRNVRAPLRPRYATLGCVLLTELERVLADADFEGTGSITITRADVRGDGLELLLDLKAWTEGFERQAWRVACANLRRFRITSDALSEMELLREHALLAPYADKKLTLGTKGAARDPKHAVADLWECHRTVAGAWFPFEEFLNQELPLVELLASNGAFLAEGPARFIRAYSDVLPGHGVEPYIVKERQPQHWLDGSWRVEDAEVELLLFSPDDYVIGVGFSAQRVSIDLLGESSTSAADVMSIYPAATTIPEMIARLGALPVPLDIERRDVEA